MGHQSENLAQSCNAIIHEVNSFIKHHEELRQAYLDYSKKVEEIKKTAIDSILVATPEDEREKLKEQVIAELLNLPSPSYISLSELYNDS